MAEVDLPTTQAEPPAEPERTGPNAVAYRIAAALVFISVLLGLAHMVIVAGLAPQTLSAANGLAVTGNVFNLVAMIGLVFAQHWARLLTILLAVIFGAGALFGTFFSVFGISGDLNFALLATTWDALLILGYLGPLLLLLIGRTVVWKIAVALAMYVLFHLGPSILGLINLTQVLSEIRG